MQTNDKPAAESKPIKERDGQADKFSIQIKGQIVGSIERSTLAKSRPDPEWEAIDDILYWTLCTRLQANRLRASLVEELNRGSTGYSLSKKRHSAMVSFEEHCVYVAARNLERALLKGPPFVRDLGIPNRKNRAALRFLRNVYEHWDELRLAFRDGGPPKERAAKNLEKGFPGAEPWRLKLRPDGDLVLAEIISCRELCQDLRRLEAVILWRLRELRKQAGAKVARRGHGSISIRKVTP